MRERKEGEIGGADDFDFGFAGGAFDGEGEEGLELGGGVFEEDESLVGTGRAVGVAEGEGQTEGFIVAEG